MKKTLVLKKRTLELIPKKTFSMPVGGVDPATIAMKQRRKNSSQRGSSRLA